MRIEQPYHEGELLVQERTGERAMGARNAAVISSTILRAAIPFLARQTMIVLGSVDKGGRVWASLLFGPPGFVSAPDERTVDFDLTGTVWAPNDPLWANLAADGRVGILAIDLESRRRIRINGRAAQIDQQRVRIEVDEAYPNCNKFIQRRHLVADWTVRGRAAGRTRRGSALEPEIRELLEGADTLFLASAHPDRGVDASHRGGNPGFVRVLDDSTLRIPDYQGNSMYNTLGNFAVYPHAGLVVPAFEAGRCVQIVGRPEIRWDLEDADNETGGTRRYWDLHVAEWTVTDLPGGLQWELLDRSTHNPERTKR